MTLPDQFCVLLSTYDGERYLSSQLESIQAQTLESWHLLIRDDGSSDGTLSQLRSYQEKDSRITVLESGNNLGACASYLKLMGLAGNAEYYAFCDQDDVWPKEKLERASSLLRPFGQKPALYCARQELINGDLKPLGMSRLPDVEPCFINALVENSAIGCTVVVNNAALELLKQRLPDPKRVVMHDWWCYLVVSAFGTVIYDPCPALAYRQHDTNTIGARGGIIFWMKRLQRFFQNRRSYPMLLQLREFQCRWGSQLTLEQWELLSSLLQGMTGMPLGKRWKWLSETPIRFQSKLDTLLFKFILLTGVVSK